MTPILAIIGLLYPARPLAAKIVRVTLAGYGMNPLQFPIEDLAEWAIRIAKLQARVKGGGYRFYLHESATTTAWTAAAVATGEPSGWSAKDSRRGVAGGSPDHIWELMARHDPKRFGLEELEKTQDLNAALLDA